MPAPADDNLSRAPAGLPERPVRVCYPGVYMKKISVQFTLEELQAAVTLAANQMFRVKYIDPKMPGYVSKPEELEAYRSALQVLQEALNLAKGLNAKTTA